MSYASEELQRLAASPRKRFGHWFPVELMRAVRNFQLEHGDGQINVSLFIIEAVVERLARTAAMKEKHQRNGGAVAA